MFLTFDIMTLMKLGCYQLFYMRFFVSTYLKDTYGSKPGGNVFRTRGLYL